MIEKEPLYIRELREDLKKHIDNKFETHIPRYFIEFRKHFDEKIEKEVGSLAISTANEFRLIREEMATKEDIAEIRKEMATKDDLKNLATKDDIKDMVVKDDIANMATKDDIKEVLSHIGSYEVRALNVEQILLKDHKPRIVDLEKKVFS
jgi:hypothetical protein